MYNYIEHMAVYNNHVQSLCLKKGVVAAQLSYFYQSSRVVFLTYYR